MTDEEWATRCRELLGQVADERERFRRLHKRLRHLLDTAKFHDDVTDGLERILSDEPLR